MGVQRVVQGCFMGISWVFYGYSFMFQKWCDNADYICQKGFSRLWMIRRLKDIGVSFKYTKNKLDQSLKWQCQSNTLL